MTYLKEKPAKQSIYFHSGCIYSALLVGASSSAEVSITIAHDYPEKYMLLTSYVFSNIKDKLVFEEPSEQQTHLNAADILVT